MTRLRATSGRTTVSPPTAEAVARVGPIPEETVVGFVGGLERGRPDAGAGRRHRVGRRDLGEQGLEAVDAVLVLVQHVRQVRLGGGVVDGVDGAPGREGGHGHLCHQGERLVAVEGAGQQVGGLDEEAQRTAAEPLELAQAGGLDGQGDPVGGELQAQGLFVRVAAGRLRCDAEGAGEAALDLEGDGHHGAHAGAAEERDGAGGRSQVVVDGGHAGRAVAAGPGLDGNAGEALAGRRQAGRRAYLQLGLVVGGQQQEGGVGVQHVAGAFHGALEEPVQVVGGGGADEDLERVGVPAVVVVGGVAAGAAGGTLQDGAFLVADQQTDRGGLALGVADAQVGGVDGDDAALGVADAVAALPAGELEGLDDAGAGAGGVRPGGEVGEGLAGDGGGRVAEEFLGVLVPRADQAVAVDLDDGDPHPAGGGREHLDGERGARGAGADGALRQVELEPDLLAGGRVVDAPPGGEGRAELEAAAALLVGAAHGQGGGLERHLALGVPVGDLDADALVGAQADDVGGGARVDDRVGDQLAGEDDGVVGDVGEAPALEGVADEGAGRGDRASHWLEAGGRPRGDHRTPCAVLGRGARRAGVRRLPLLCGKGVRRPDVLRGLLPRDQSGRHALRDRPSDAQMFVLPPPGPDGTARPDSLLQGYLPSRSARMPVDADYVRRVCGRCAGLPNCYGLVGTR
jgi:hypothetical protein